MTALDALLAKYDTPGPRYTSYPTVPYWEGGVTEATWIKHLVTCLGKNTAPGVTAKHGSVAPTPSHDLVPDGPKVDDNQAPGFGIYVHIPFCEKLCAYCACHTFPTKDHTRSIPYVKALLKEWELYLRHLQGFDLALGELHFGGGTPTFLCPDQLATICEALLSSVRVLSTARLSVEVDPRVTSPEQLRILRSFGFNRLSIGVQDFTPEVQRAVNRIQEPGLVERQVELARELGFGGINFDLIYGLPRQTTATFAQTIKQVIELQPDRLALYSYAHVPWMKQAQQQWREEDLPLGPEKWALYLAARAALLNHGYLEIGMDHFALPHDPLAQAATNRTLHRNFMGYTESFTAPLIGLGVSAIGDALTCFVQNTKELDEYYTSLTTDKLPLHRGHILSRDDLRIRQSILNLMTRLETELDDYPEASSRLVTAADYKTAAEYKTAADSEVANSVAVDILSGLGGTDLGEMIADGLVSLEKTIEYPSLGEQEIAERGNGNENGAGTNGILGEESRKKRSGGRVTKLRILSTGKPFVRNVCMALDKRLQASKRQIGKQVFSRTV